MPKVITGSNVDQSQAISDVKEKIRKSFDWSSGCKMVFVTAKDIAEIIHEDVSTGSIIRIGMAMKALGAKQKKTRTAKLIQVPSIVFD